MLDRSRDFGQVHGEPGVKYVQDGKHYDGAGKEIIYPAVPAPVEPAPEPVVVAAEPPVAAPVAAEPVRERASDGHARLRLRK